MKKVSIIDYGMGNIASITKAFQIIGVNPQVISDPKKVNECGRLVIPGVGGFGDSMKELRRYNLIEPLRKYVETGNPLLGICLGMQVLFESSEEKGKFDGLNFIEGNVVKIPSDFKNDTKYRKIPHIGWNSIMPDTSQWNSKIFNNIEINDFFYFIHSYMCKLKYKKYRIAYSNYNECEITSGVQVGNIIGLQFHPEKSGVSGLRVLKNFIEYF